MNTEISKRLEAAYLLHRVVEARESIFKLIDRYGFDEGMTLKEVLDNLFEKKRAYEKTIDE